MVIVAVDPGPVESAFVVLNISNQSLKIKYKDKVANPKIKDLFRLLYHEMDGGRFVFSIEGLQSFGMPVGQDTFETAYFIGELRQFYQSLYQSSNPGTMVYRKDIKMHFCNSMRAKDANIRQALIDRYGAIGTKKEPGFLYGVTGDMWSALAIATYTHDKYFT